MSAYLARLKQLENEKIFHYAPDNELTKLSKASFVSFGGTGAGHIEKKITDSEIPKPETLQDRQREARRQKVIAMLVAAPDTPRAIYVDDASDPASIILAVAVRHPTGATCEMLVSKTGCGVWRVMELVERHGQSTH